MRYRLILFFALFFAYGTKCQVLWQIKNNEIKKWFYTDGDEFNSISVNPDKWKYGPDWGNSVVNQSVYFTDGQNVFLKDGEAHFVARREDYKGHVYKWEYDSALLKRLNLRVVDESLPFKYTAGALWSKRKFKHGYFECRFKSNSQKGIWPAFWLYAGNDNDEIDWFELKGERPNQAHVDVHCPDGCENYRGGFMNLKKGWGGWIKLTHSLDEYNTISGEWNDNYMIWYLNGEPLCYFAHDYKVPMWLVMNTSVASNNNGGFSPAPDNNTIFPNEFIVDYVRVWSLRDTSGIDPLLFAGSDKTINSTQTAGKAQLKKPLRYLYNKNVLSQELGFVTLLPLGESRYSLTFSGPRITSAKIEVTTGNQKVKESNLSNSAYIVLDLKDLKKGNYMVNIYVLGKTLSQEIRLE